LNREYDTYFNKGICTSMCAVTAFIAFFLAMAGLSPTASFTRLRRPLSENRDAFALSRAEDRLRTDRPSGVVQRRGKAFSAQLSARPSRRSRTAFAFGTIPSMLL